MLAIARKVNSIALLNMHLTVKCCHIYVSEGLRNYGLAKYTNTSRLIKDNPKAGLKKREMLKNNFNSFYTVILK